MACCNCCEKTLNLGCINSCNAELNTGIIATIAGVWILELNFSNVTIYYSFNAALFDIVIFTLENLNENYTYTGQIIDPNGNVVKLSIDGIEHDCIEFSTKVGLSNNTINL